MCINFQKVKHEVILQTRGLIQHHDSSKHLKEIVPDRRKTTANAEDNDYLAI